MNTKHCPALFISTAAGEADLTLPEGELRGHTRHHSQIECTMEPLTQTTSARHHGRPEKVYRNARLTASYMHLHFPSNIDAAARLFLQ